MNRQERRQVAKTARAAVLSAGVVKYPPRMVKPIMDMVEETLAGGILWFLERDLPGLEAELAVFHPEAETKAPEPKVSGAMKKLAREVLEEIAELVAQHSRGELPEDTGWNYRDESGTRRLENFVTAFYVGGRGLYRGSASLDKLKHHEMLTDIKAALKKPKFDQMTDEEVQVFAAALLTAANSRKYKYSKGAEKSWRLLDDYLKQRADLRSRKAGEAVPLGSWDEQDKQRLEQKAKRLRELYDYLKSKGYQKTKFKPGPKREVKVQVPVDLTGLPEKYPTEAFKQGLYDNITLRIMPARTGFAGSWNPDEKEMMIVLGNYPMSLKGLNAALRDTESTLKHELEHMVQYIMKDSLKLRKGLHLDEPGEGSWGPAGTPFSKHSSPQSPLARDLQLQERYPTASKDERYFLSPIEFFPQIGSAVNRFLDKLLSPMFGEAMAPEDIRKDLKDLWRAHAKAGHHRAILSPDPFFEAYKKHNPKMWRRAVSEGWQRLLRRMQQMELTATVSARRKISPDEFRAEHGRCPIGYRYQDQEGCEPYTKVAKKTAVKTARVSKVVTKNFLKNASGFKKKFFSDAAFRKKSLKSMGEGLRKSPKAFAKNLVKAAKHEVHEFKEAGAGLKALAKGQKLSQQQKTAIRKVATHLAISTAAAAATAHGLGIPLAIAKAMGRGLVVKAISPVFEKLHMADEVRHVTHLFHADDDIMMRLAKAKDEDEAMEILGEQIALGMADALDAEMDARTLFDIASQAASEEAASEKPKEVSAMAALSPEDQRWLESKLLEILVQSYEAYSQRPHIGEPSLTTALLRQDLENERLPEDYRFMTRSDKDKEVRNALERLRRKGKITYSWGLGRGGKEARVWEPA